MDGMEIAEAYDEGWTRYYSEFADILRGYKNNQAELIEKVKRAFASQGVRLPKLDNGELTEIDPFTVFALFNRGIVDETRRKILLGFKEEFAVQSPVPLRFCGVPMANNLSTTFYRFSPDRETKDISYLIGMMNTADRSLAMMDYALRRRFAFYEMTPAFRSDGFRGYREGLKSEKFNRLISVVEQLNDAIANDDSLGRGFRIGHSFFCGIHVANSECLARIVDFELVPLLEEYWFDEPAKINNWSNRLKSAVR